MQTIRHALGWVVQRLLFLALLTLTTALVLLLPVMLVANRPYPGSTRVIYSIEPGRLLETVRLHLAHLIGGQLVPTHEPNRLEAVWLNLPQEMAAALLTSLRLAGFALLVSLALGFVAGWLMSTLGPRQLRRPVWAITTALSCVPDLLVATIMNLSLFLLGVLLGRQLRTPDYPLWQQYYAPAIALILLVAPYVARVTATAIDQVAEELYIRTAVAKGLPASKVILKHIGKNVLLNVWRTFPMVLSILISGTAIVEYMTEVRGIGRALILAVGPNWELWYGDRFAGVYLLLPVVLIVTISFGLSDLGLRRLDPRPLVTPSAPGGWRPSRGQRPPPRRWSIGRGLSGLRQAALMWGDWLRERLGAIPGGLRSAAGALRSPTILAGTLLVLGLVLVAVLAPQLAPYGQDQRFSAFQDSTGKVYAPPFAPGQAGHILGTDRLGRDVWSRVLFGTRYALLLAALVVPARFALAAALGLPAAWWGGLWARLVEWLGVFFAALPQFLLPLALIPVVNLLFEKNVAASLVWGVLLVALPGVPRLASSICLQAREVLGQPFVEGAVAAGAGPGRILMRHLLPQIAPQLLTLMTLEVPVTMTLTATLGFFHASPGGWIRDTATGDFVAPVLPEWGSMMENPVILVLAGRWWMLAPFAGLFLAVLAFSLLGEGLRHAGRSRGGWA